MLDRAIRVQAIKKLLLAVHAAFFYAQKITSQIPEIHLMIWRLACASAGLV